MRFPLLTSLLQLFLGNAEFDGVLDCVDMDDITIPYEGYRTTDLSLGRDVTDAKPVRPESKCATSEK